MDAEEITKAREHAEAVRLYRMHYWTHFILVTTFTVLLIFLLWSRMPESPVGAAIVFAAITGVSFALATLVCARPFKRKTRFWHLRTHPDDKDPRK